MLMGEMNMDYARRAENLFIEGYNCCQAVFVAFAERYGLTREEALRISSAFGAGFGGSREICGVVSGMTLVCGLECGAVTPDAKAKKACYDKEQELLAAFKAKTGGKIICRELLGIVAGETLPYASERSEAYYRTRPCIKLVTQAAQILEETFVQKA